MVQFLHHFPLVDKNCRCPWTMALSGAVWAAMLMAVTMVSRTGRAAACVDDSGCYGGVCRDQTCACPPLFEGPRCGALRLAPAKVGGGLWIRNTTTWGGGAVRGDDKRWHLYAARMVGGCGLKTWTTNSEIIHAVGTEVDGPYTVDSTPMFQTFSHNPTIQLVDPGKRRYVLGMIGCGGGSKTPRDGCSNGTTCNTTWCWSPSDATSADSAPTNLGNVSGLANENKKGERRMANGGALNDEKEVGAGGGGCDTPHWTGLATTEGSPDGPWTVVTPKVGGGVQVDCSTAAACWHTPSITNPSIWPLGNGSVFMAYSTGCPNCSVSPGHKHIGIAFGLAATGPFVDVTPAAPIFPFASEDPAIWHDTTNSISNESWHLFSHTDYSGVAENNTWAHVSAHAVATSPWGPWRVVPDPPYTRTVTWDSHPPTSLQTRERPQVLFEDGTPVALSNGAQPGNNSSPWYPDGYTGDWSFTLVQRLNPRA